MSRIQDIDILSFQVAAVPTVTRGRQKKQSRNTRKWWSKNRKPEASVKRESISFSMSISCKSLLRKRSLKKKWLSRRHTKIDYLIVLDQKRMMYQHSRMRNQKKKRTSKMRSWCSMKTSKIVCSNKPAMSSWNCVTKEYSSILIRCASAGTILSWSYPSTTVDGFHTSKHLRSMSIAASQIWVVLITSTTPLISVSSSISS